MVEWIAVRCAQCGTYQCIQKPKPTGKRNPTRKFSCRMCSKQQSIVKTFAISEQPSDIRGVVQSLNARRAETEQNNEQQVLSRLRDRSNGSDNDDYNDDDQSDEDYQSSRHNKRRRYSDSDSDAEIARVFNRNAQRDPDDDHAACENDNTSFNPFDSPARDDDEQTENARADAEREPAVSSFRLPHEQRDSAQHTATISNAGFVSSPAIDVNEPASSQPSAGNAFGRHIDEAELDDLLEEAESLF